MRHALEWFNTCRDTHPQCQPKDPSFRPTRLLYLGSSSPESQVKLEEFSNNSNPDLPIRYACLSHCWGSVEPACMTTDMTIGPNKVAIDWSEIPKTFQQAIVFTRNLGLQYLWIDSLCIIQKQDDQRDWLREGAMMANIYSNATITIAAMSAHNCNEGWDDGRDEPSRAIWSCGSRTCRWFSVPREWLHRVPPLARRAWFFQEYILSRRLIHFDFEDVVWKCQSVAACPSRNHRAPRTGPLIYNKEEDVEEWKSMAKWNQTASFYSALQITHQGDRLAALSGVAKASGHLERGHRYVAGLWMKSSGIPLALDWGTCRLRVGRRQQADEWAAPSWSWASACISSRAIDGGVTDQWPSTTHPESEPAFTIEDLRLNFRYPDDSTETGPLLREGTSITVSGCALKATLVYQNVEDIDAALGRKKRCRNVLYLASVPGFDIPFQPDYTINDNSNVEGYLSTGSTIYCFFLFSTRGPPIPRTKDRPKHVFLVLSQNDRGADEPIFERIGLLTMWNDEEYATLIAKGLLVPNLTFCIV